MKEDFSDEFITIDDTANDEIVLDNEPVLNIYVGNILLTATLIDNSTTQALVELLAEGPIEIDMQDYANMEKVGTLPAMFPRNDEYIHTQPGDLIVYQGNSFVIYYDINSWNLTKIGEINDITQQELKEILGDNDVTIILSLYNE